MSKASTLPRMLPQVKLGQFLAAPGDALSWLYDIGDGWHHLIYLEEVHSAEESSGAAALLAGGGACPPEDSVGLEGMGKFQARPGSRNPLSAPARLPARNPPRFVRLMSRLLCCSVCAAALLGHRLPPLPHNSHAVHLSSYIRFLDPLSLYPREYVMQELLDLALKSPKSPAVKKALREGSSASNYRGKAGGFDPLRPFDIEQARTDLAGALRSTGSDRSAAMHTVMPLTPGAGPFWPGGPRTATQTATQDHGPFGPWTVHGASAARDSRETALCHQCGSAREGLQMCGGCKSLWFCGKECLTAAWKAGHKQECKVLAAKREAEKAEKKKDKGKEKGGGSSGSTSTPMPSPSAAAAGGAAAGGKTKKKK